VICSVRRCAMARTRQKPPDYPPEIRRGIAYADAVATGRAPAGKWAVLAAQRFKRDREAAERGESRWILDPEYAIRPIRFAGQMQNIKGPEAGQTLDLLDFQLWLLINLYGFVERMTGLRRFRQASIWLPKGNAKSTLVAVLALYSTFLEGEGSAEGYAAAVSRDQARIVFDLAQAMTRANTTFRERVGLQIREHSIVQHRTQSRLMPISSDAKTLDGLNVYIAILDELASHRSKGVYGALITAMGKRAQPLLISISTTTDNTTGVGKQVWDYSLKVLEGLVDERFLAIHLRRGRS